MKPANSPAAEHRGTAPRRLELVPKSASWLTCSPEAPWGVHAAMVGRSCRRCGWTAD